ncbi:DMT family transporter [Altererythrobacter sp. MF3-039]|uniref:DMT family transporter n=1 Tax=Altererythrobacter sp. MF3-039 TaxID=3252901 RepID=UPI00390C45CA
MSAETGAQSQSLLHPRNAISFLLVSLIWGSTWWVILGQIEAVSPTWSVAMRFAIAAPAMFVVALVMGKSLALGKHGHLLALAIGLVQFGLNLNFVYRAELHLTSGIVATMFGLQIVTNAVLGLIFLGQQITRNFVIGTFVALTGVSLLLVHEWQAGKVGGDVPLGIVLAIAGILAASIANIMQAGKTGRSVPMVSMLAWAMLYGTLMNVAFAWAIAGPPVFPSAPEFWAGLAWLALAGSVLTFPLHYTLVREIGAGRATYSNILVIIIAMLLSTVFEGYSWTPLTASGAVFALAGLLIALRARKPSR